MVYNIQNHWVCELGLSSIIPNKYKTRSFENYPLRFSGEGREIPTPLGLSLKP
jgi:hypothetical protein